MFALQSGVRIGQGRVLVPQLLDGSVERYLTSVKAVRSGAYPLFAPALLSFRAGHLLFLLTREQARPLAAQTTVHLAELLDLHLALLLLTLELDDLSV